MSKALISEARGVASMYRRAGLEHGIEPLLDRLADELESALALIAEMKAYEEMSYWEARS